MVEKYDTVVIGAGPAGTAAASSLKAQDKKQPLWKKTYGAALVRTVGATLKKILYAAVEAKEKADLLAEQD